MVLRRLSDEDLLNLHVLMRCFCQEMNFQNKTLARQLAETLSDPKQVDSVYKQLVAFLNKGTTGPMNDVLPLVVEPLGELFDRAASGNIPFAEYLFLVLSGETTKQSEQFFSPLHRSKYMTKPVLDRAAKSDPQLALMLQVKKGYATNIGRAFGLLSLTADQNGRETTLSEPRLDDQHLVAIRRSSLDAGRFSVHGLKFQRHILEESVMFFSEKYYTNAEAELNGEGLGDLNQRQSFGVSFFEGRYLFAAARSTSSQMMTVLTGRLPEGESIEAIEGFITTSNSESYRINAEVLCLRCEDEGEKYHRMGNYDLDELMEVTPEAQRRVLEDWLDAHPDKPSRL